MEFVIVSRKGSVFEYTPVEVSAITGTSATHVAAALKTATDQLVQAGQVIVQVIKL